MGNHSSMEVYPNSGDIFKCFLPQNALQCLIIKTINFFFFSNYIELTPKQHRIHIPQADRNSLKSSTHPHTPLQFEGYSNAEWLITWNICKEIACSFQITIYQTSVCIWILCLFYIQNTILYEIYWQSQGGSVSAICLRCDFCLPSMNVIKIKAKGIQSKHYCITMDISLGNYKGT